MAEGELSEKEKKVGLDRAFAGDAGQVNGFVFEIEDALDGIAGGNIGGVHIFPMR